MISLGNWIAQGLRLNEEVVSFGRTDDNPRRSRLMHIGSAIALGLLATALIAAPPALALTCSDQVVQARGEPSRFEVIAKAKARGNWRAQVRALPNFGALYANWSIAASADYNCTEERDGIMCIAMARPCRE